MRSTDNGRRRRSVGLWPAAAAGIALGCVSGPGGSLPPPTNIAPQPQAQLATEMWAADGLGYDVLIGLVLECHNVDAENDALAERNTPVLED